MYMSKCVWVCMCIYIYIHTYIPDMMTLDVLRDSLKEVFLCRACAPIVIEMP